MEGLIILLRIPLVLFLLIFHSHLLAKEEINRVYGKFVSKENEFEIPVTLDLIPTEKKTDTKLLAILKFSFEDYHSDEYVTYRYLDAFRDSKGAYVFPPAEQDLILSEWKDLGNKIKVDVFSIIGGGSVGEIIFFGEDPSKIKFTKLLPKLEGYYEKPCSKKEEFLSLFTGPSFFEAPLPGNPFGRYAVVGSFGQKLRMSTTSTKEKRSQYSVSNAVYNFFTGEINFSGRLPLNCEVSQKGIDCKEDCAYQKISNHFSIDKKKPNFEQFQFLKYKFKKTNQKADGNYVGYVFNENLGMHLEIGMTIKIIPKPASSVFIAAASVYSIFNEPGKSTVKVINRFDPKELTSESLEKVTFFTQPRPFTPADSILRITYADSETIQGYFYSWFYGRLGPFLLRKNNRE